MAKFDIGELLIFKRKERQRIDLLTALEQVTDIQNGQYFLSDYGAIDIEQAEKEYVSVNEVLWQHYILDTLTDKLTPFNGPMTIEKANELFKASQTNHTILLQAEWKGFWLPEEDKIEMQFIDGDVLVRRSDEGKPIKDNENYLFTIEEADQDAGLYFLSNGQAIDMETAHSDYLDAFGSKVLWYWEIKTDGDWSMPTSTRKTFQEAIELTSNDNKPVTQRRALYSLGFSIKE